jgi:hypothetical protein
MLEIVGAAGAVATAAKVPAILPLLILPVPEAPTVVPFAEVLDLFLNLMYKVVPAFTDMDNPVAFTSAGVVPLKLDAALSVQVPANASLIVVDKTTQLYLQEGTSISVTSGTASGITYVISYEDMS